MRRSYIHETGRGNYSKTKSWNKFSVLAKTIKLAQTVSSSPKNQPGELHGQLVKTNIAGPYPLGPFGSTISGQCQSAVGVWSEVQSEQLPLGINLHPGMLPPKKLKAKYWPERLPDKHRGNWEWSAIVLWVLSLLTLGFTLFFSSSSMSKT